VNPNGNNGLPPANTPRIVKDGDKGWRVITSAFERTYSTRAKARQALDDYQDRVDLMSRFLGL